MTISLEPLQNLGAAVDPLTIDVCWVFFVDSKSHLETSLAHEVCGRALAAGLASGIDIILSLESI